MTALETQTAPLVVTGGPAANRSQWLVTGANLEPRFGGISSVVGSLCHSASASGDCRISLASFGQGEGPAASPEVPVYRYPLTDSQWFTGAQWWRSLARRIEDSDGVHIHGIWQKHCAFSAHLSRRARKPYLISAHGMLDSWALRNKSWKKRAYLALIETRNLQGATCLHALTRAEAADYRRIAPSVPVAVIPNGVSIPGGDPELFLEQFPELRGRRLVLFLGRIHYKKGLDLLCRAWSRLEAQWPDAQLVVAGPDFENTRFGIEALATELGSRERITFTGMLTGAAKWGALAASEVFVLPSYSEGLSVSVLEAMGMGLPVIISAECNLPEVRSAGCGWVIELREAALESALREALAAPGAVRRGLGERGRELVVTRYSWPVIGAQVSALYSWILGGQRPSSVEALA